MRNTWTYEGNISSYTCSRNLRGETCIDIIELRDRCDRSKAPVMLRCSCSLFGYIFDIEDNDDEEKYLRKQFIYDDILTIREIRILNNRSEVVKIIREVDEAHWNAIIEGPRDRINYTNPEALRFTDREKHLVSKKSWN